MYELIEKVLTEEAGTATVEGNISYLPSSVGAVTSAIHGLAKLGQEYDIDFADDDKHRTVNFGKQLSVKVPKQYWNEFSQKYKINKSGKTSLSHLLKEAIEDELEELRKQIKPALVQFFDKAVFHTLDKQINIYRSFFGVSETYDTRAMISPDKRERDIQFLTQKITKQYGCDKGHLELLLQALRGNDSLNAFEVFNRFQHLYGTKILSLFRKVQITFEALINSAYQTNLSIIIDPRYPSLIDTLEDDPHLMKEIKIERNTLYPIGGQFKPSTYSLLKNYIKELEE